MQVATYDVGGTQSMQQSSMSSHGSNTNDVSYNIDGATVNWPGGGGGATMLYYDQGMFEEVNYMTSAIPAEVHGRRRLDQHGDQGRRQQVARQRALQLRQRRPAGRRTTGRGCRRGQGRPRPSSAIRRKKTYDFNLSGGGALVQNRLWVNGTIRKLGGQQAGQREEPRRQPGARRQRPEELLRQGGRRRSRPTTR